MAYQSRYTSRYKPPSETARTDRLLAVLEEKYAKELQPKAGTLERILAPMTGIGSGIDAYYDALSDDKKAGIFETLGEYGKNVLQGFGTFITGRRYEDKMEGLSEVIDYYKPEWKETKWGGNPWVRGAIDIAGGLVTDPLTWVTMGASSVSSNVAKSGAKAAGLSDDIAKKVVGMSFDDATKLVAKEVGPEAADAFTRGAMAVGGRKGMTKGALKAFGKTVTEDPGVIRAARAIANPAGAIAETAVKGLDIPGAIPKIGGTTIPGLRDIFPDQYIALRSILNPAELAEEMGRQGLGQATRQFQSSQRAAQRQAFKELSDSGVLATWKKLSNDEKANLGKLIEQTRLAGKKGPQAYEEIVGDVIMRKGSSKELKNFLTTYGHYQKKSTAALQEAGFDVLDLMEQMYVGRGKAVAFSPEYLKKTAIKQFKGLDVDAFLQKPNVIKDMAKNDGWISRKLLEKELGTHGEEILGRYDPGPLQRALFGKGATKERAFESIALAEEKGVKYGQDWLYNIQEQGARKYEQIAGERFSLELRGLTDDLGQPRFQTEASDIANTKVEIPGVDGGLTRETLYTDKATARIANTVLGSFKTKSDTDLLLSGFDKFMRYWKGMVTAKGPALWSYHLRNAFDDAIRMFVGGHKMTRMPQNMAIGQQLVAYDDAMRAGKSIGDIDTDMVDAFYKEMGLKPARGLSNIEDLWQRTVENGVFGSVGQTVAQSGAMDGVPIELAKAAGKKMSKGQELNAFLTRIGTEREQMFRVGHFAEMWRQTGSSELASQEVRNVLFNYDELTDVERKVAKRIVPFYSFTKNNLKFYLDTLQDNPERLAKFSNVLDGLQSGSQSLYGEEWEAMPDWMKDQFAMPIGKTDEGDLKVWTGLGLSVEGLDKLPFSVAGAKGAAQDINPILKYLIERGTGQSLYFDKPIEDITSGERMKNYPEVLKKLFGYREYEMGEGADKWTKRTVMPYRQYDLRNLPMLDVVTRGVSAPLDVYSEFKEKGFKDAYKERFLTDFIRPGKIYKQDVGREQARTMNEAEAELYELLRSKGMASTYERSYIPSGLRKQLIKELQGGE